MGRFSSVLVMLAIDDSPNISATKNPELDFAKVYREHFDFVYRVVARLSGGSLADDLTQDVFLVVHRRLPGFESRAALTTWLFRIAYRIVGAHVRKERRNRKLLEVFGRRPSVPPQTAPMTLEQSQLRRQLIESANHLSWKKRSVLILHDVEEWSVQEIAAKIDISVNTVYSRLRAARIELARRFRASSDGEEGGK